MNESKVNYSNCSCIAVFCSINTSTNSEKTRESVAWIDCLIAEVHKTYFICDEGNLFYRVSVNKLSSHELKSCDLSSN